ncbi:MAG: protease modulator HflC [Eubacteriales bacterium]|nr:protease modulator HflC [Eubacteriales bacterium]MDD3074796.1 protease modulator HflC [Eubacteriales bacterium]
MKKSIRKWLLLGAAALGIYIIFNLFTFQVAMTEHAIVTRFGEIHKIVVNDASALQSTLNNPRFKDLNIVEGNGLFFKVPFLDKVDYYNDRLITYDVDAREVTTKDKKKVILDNYAQWKIINPALFRVTMRSEANAYVRLEDIIYSNLNQQIGKINAEVLISDKDYVKSMLAEIVKQANIDVKDYGIEIIDVRIKRTDLPQENNANIFNRMRTERERMAMQYRSEGQEEAQKIRSDADREATIIEAQAYAEAERIRGEGEAEALKIYAQSYGQDPEFYEFYQTLQTYRATLKDNTTLVIDSDSDFAKFLFGSR